MTVTVQEVAPNSAVPEPVAVIPMHDPSGIMFPHLRIITPQLKEIFSRVFVSVTAVTAESHPHHIAWLKSEPFLQALYHQVDVSVGQDFLSLYTRAASACHPEQVLHLCFVDRVAFALEGRHRDPFVADVESIEPEDTPLLFQRSSNAWQTHPQNYRELEQMVTRVGELLFGKSLEFAWCHLVLQARELKALIPHIKSRDLSMFAEFTLKLRDEIQCRDVDWLAWEDPFILSRDGQQLKAEREACVDETRKRLAYVMPMLQLISEAANERHG